MLVLVLLAYAIGCVSPGYLLVRRRTGVDLRASSTGSTGARNAGRAAGTRVAAAVFLLDAAKGAVAVGIARIAGLDDGGQALCLLAVVAGHVLPAQLRFRGGRGLSPALGGMLVLSPVSALIGLAVCLVLAATTRAFTAAGMAGAVAGAAATWLTEPAAAALPVSAAAAVVCLAHLRGRQLQG